MEKVGWSGIVMAGWPVLSILLLGSIVMFAVIVERWRVFSRIQVNTGPFLNSLRQAMDIQKIIEWCEKSDQPLALITKTICQSTPSREDMERGLQRAIQISVHKLEEKISILGTIASVAPFVGLLGTVVGIMRSFRAVSMSSSAGASLVALGISEALVGTAAGLIVAIPALLGYNYFVNKLRRLTQDWEIAGAEIIDLALKQTKR